MKNHIFISYSHKDRFFAEYLENIVTTKTDYEVWRDYKIESGDDWAIEIDNALHQSFVLILIVSPDSNTSQNVIYEWSFVRGRKIPVIPVMFRPLTNDELNDTHYKIKNSQVLDLSSQTGAGWQNLLEKLHSIERKYTDTQTEFLTDADKIALKNIEKELELSQEYLINLREERSGLQTRLKTLTVEGYEMNERIETLENSKGAICPLCGQVLEDTHRASILEELNNERDVKREEYRQATERIADIGDERAKKSKYVDELNNILSSRRKYNDKF